jgi:hypothetical protein
MDCKKFHFKIEGELVADQTATFTVSVKAAQTGLTLTPDGAVLPDEVVGVASNDEVTTISGGTPPYTFSVSAGATPDGMQLFSEDNADGSETLTIEGTPTTEEDSSFDITVTDSAVPPASVTRKATVSAKKAAPARRR